MKSYTSKWQIIGVERKDVKRIYQNIRQKSKTILINKHKKEYNKIMKKQLEKKFREYCRVVKNER